MRTNNKWLGVRVALATCVACLSLLVWADRAPGQGSSAGGAIRAWAGDIHDPDDKEAGAAPAAISIVGARNGAFSGKVVLSAPGALAGLKATAGELKGPGVIPASAVRIRYGVPWEAGLRVSGADLLLEAPPAEFPAGRAVPVWVTVSVPKDAKAGAYSGQVALQAAGSPPLAVPVKLDVRDWTLPDTQDYRTWTELIQSPDTLAVEYELPLWSDRHWEMIAASLRLIAATGSRVLYLPLIARTNYGNAESMVRWVKKGDDRYEYDFSIAEKYLDLAARNMGTPKVIILNAWDVYLKPPDKEVVVSETDSAYQKMEKSHAQARYALKGKGPAVTVLGGDAGAGETVYLPPYHDPACKALWKPLWEGLRQRMAARGLGGQLMLGVVSDIQPTREEVATLQELSGGLPWTSCTHHARWIFPVDAVPKGQLFGIATIAYSAVALDHQYVIDPTKDRCYGWKKPFLHGQYWRFAQLTGTPLCWIRHEQERNITGNQRGLAHVGGDFWPCGRAKTGRRTSTVTDRFSESYWHSLNTGGWLLGPGPDGPVGTARLEVFREGIQECEARIAIEEALTDPARKARLGAELARRAQDTLDEKLRAVWKSKGIADSDLNIGLVSQYRAYYQMASKWNTAAGQRWFLGSGWANRAGELFDVAGQVAAKLGRK